MPKAKENEKKQREEQSSRPVSSLAIPPSSQPPPAQTCTLLHLHIVPSPGRQGLRRWISGRRVPLHSSPYVGMKAAPTPWQLAWPPTSETRSPEQSAGLGNSCTWPWRVDTSGLSSSGILHGVLMARRLVLPRTQSAPSGGGELSLKVAPVAAVVTESVRLDLLVDLDILSVAQKPQPTLAEAGESRLL